MNIIICDDLYLYTVKCTPIILHPLLKGVLIYFYFMIYTLFLYTHLHPVYMHTPFLTVLVIISCFLMFHQSYFFYILNAFFFIIIIMMCVHSEFRYQSLPLPTQLKMGCTAYTHWCTTCHLKLPPRVCCKGVYVPSREGVEF